MVEIIEKEPKFKAELKQSAKGDWYVGGIGVKGDDMKDVVENLSQLKKSIEKVLQEKGD